MLHVREPNITGTSGSYIADGNVAEGALGFGTNGTSSNGLTPNSGSRSRRTVTLNASSSNSIYGNSTTVQSRANQALIIIRA